MPVFFSIRKTNHHTQRRYSQVARQWIAKSSIPSSNLGIAIGKRVASFYAAPWTLRVVGVEESVLCQGLVSLLRPTSWVLVVW